MNISDHFTNPRNVGEMQGPSAVAEESNPVCGDRLRLYLQVAGRQIQAASFLAYGCPPSIACGSALTELLPGKTIDEALLITKQKILDAVGGLPSRKHHAAALAIETLRAALKKMS